MYAFVSGGTGGIGRAIVKRFAESGISVVFGYHKNEAQKRELERLYGAEGIRADLANEESLARLCETLRARGFGILVNNAGVSYTGLLQDTPESKIAEVLHVNLTASIRIARAVLPHMLRAGYGRIVSVSSVWGVVGGSCESVYSAAKAGLIGFTKALAKEVGPGGVTVNAVAPGCIDTPMLACYDEETRRALALESAIGRLGSPDDVAAAVSYLAGAESGFVTGQILGVDGGFY